MFGNRFYKTLGIFFGIILVTLALITIISGVAS